MQRHDLSFNALKQIAKGITQQFGPNCEVAVHSLAGQTTDFNPSIVAIENRHVLWS